MPGINLVTQLRNPGSASSGGSADLESGGGSSFLERFRSMSSDGADWSREDTVRVVLAIIGIAGLFGMRYFVEDYTAKQQVELDAQVSQLDQQIAAENKKFNSLKGLKAEAEAYDKQMAELQRKLELVESVSKNRNLVVRMTDFLVTEMPPSIWLGKLNLEAGDKNEVEINGGALNLQIVSEYVKRLEGAVFFPKWQLKETVADASAGPGSGAQQSKGTVKTAPVPRDTKRFQISAKVVAP